MIKGETENHLSLSPAKRHFRICDLCVWTMESINIIVSKEKTKWEKKNRVIFELHKIILLSKKNYIKLSLFGISENYNACIPIDQ